MEILSNMRTTYKPRPQIPFSPPSRMTNAQEIENLTQ
jgi:hypothetical protein